MASIAKRPTIEASKQLLASKNISATKPRLILVGLLLKENRPLTVDQVVKLAKGNLALSSLYRVINDLRDCGLIAEFTTPENTKVIEIITNTSRHHHHIFCGNCDSITDFEIDDQLERDLASEIQRIENEYSISVISHSLELLSLCVPCKKKLNG
jgi:Fe2+ or Zn2+ uptake regulation protein